MNLEDFKEISDRVSSQVEKHRTEMLEMIKTYMMIYKKNNSNKIEIIPKDEYLKIHHGDLHDYFKLDESMLNPVKFNIGDIVHTVDCHCLENGYGNDNHAIMFINPKIITGKYRIIEPIEDNPGDYYGTTIVDIFGSPGDRVYLSKEIILENYQNSNLIK